MREFTNVVWESNFVRVPRKGFFGKLIDIFKKQYRTGFGGFIAVTKDGETIKSKDGVNWTIPIGQ